MRRRHESPASTRTLLALLASLPEEARFALLALLRRQQSGELEHLSETDLREAGSWGSEAVTTVRVPAATVVVKLVARVEELERRLREVERRHAPGLVTIKQAAQRIPALTEDALRAHIKRRKKNGLQETGALIKKGRRWLIDLSKLVRWLETGRQ